MREHATRGHFGSSALKNSDEMRPGFRATCFSRFLASLWILSTGAFRVDTGAGRKNGDVSAIVSVDGSIQYQDHFCGGTLAPQNSCANVSLGHLGSRQDRLVECRKRYVVASNNEMYLCWFLNDEGQCDSALGMCECLEVPGMSRTQRARDITRSAYPNCPGYVMLFPPAPTPPSYLNFGVCMQFTGTADPNDSGLQSALVNAAEAEVGTGWWDSATITNIQSGCGGATPPSLVDVGILSTFQTHQSRSLSKRQTSIEAEFEVRLPPGQNSVPSQFTADLESSSGTFSSSVAAAYTAGGTVSVQVTHGPGVSDTRAPTASPSPNPTPAGLKIRSTNVIDILPLYFGLVLGCIDADRCKYFFRDLQDVHSFAPLQSQQFSNCRQHFLWKF